MVSVSNVKEFLGAISWWEGGPRSAPPWVGLEQSFGWGSGCRSVRALVLPLHGVPPKLELAGGMCFWGLGPNPSTRLRLLIESIIDREGVLASFLEEVATFPGFNGPRYGVDGLWRLLLWFWFRKWTYRLSREFTASSGWSKVWVWSFWSWFLCFFMFLTFSWYFSYFWTTRLLVCWRAPFWSSRSSWTFRAE